MQKKKFLMLNLRLNKNIFFYLVYVLCLLPSDFFFKSKHTGSCLQKRSQPLRPLWSETSPGALNLTEGQM